MGCIKWVSKMHIKYLQSKLVYSQEEKAKEKLLIKDKMLKGFL